MASTFVSTKTIDGITVARLHCEKLAEREATILQVELLAAAKASAWKIVLDVSEVMLLASVGLGALVTINKDCKAGGGKLVVFGLAEEIREVLRVTRLERVLTIAKDQESAVLAFA